MRRPQRISAVIPTTGASPLLPRCLAALRHDDEVEIVVVDQSPTGIELPAGLADRLLRLESNRGFAEATNLGIEASDHPFVATVNDDVLVDPGWSSLLRAALTASPEVAAVQGANLILDRSEVVDGCGLAWSRSWQAQQIGRGEAAPMASAPPAEVFGVSATAALYRRSALRRVAGSRGQVFDPALHSYYEDVDLACRLRAAGFSARLVPGARAYHAGSTTGIQWRACRQRWIYSNRHLVLARLLGRAFWPRLPLFVLRDLADVGHRLRRGEGGCAPSDLLAAWRRGLRLLPRFAHLGRAAIPPRELKRFRLNLHRSTGSLG